MASPCPREIVIAHNDNKKNNNKNWKKQGITTEITTVLATAIRTPKRIGITMVMATGIKATKTGIRIPANQVSAEIGYFPRELPRV